MIIAMIIGVAAAARRLKKSPVRNRARTSR